jgi:transglutaminase-like putative cysteine protease
MSRSFLLLLFLFLNLSLSAQYSQPFGNVTVKELEMDHFPGDPEAEAMAIFEYGVYTFKLKDNGYIYLMKEYHTKIKILNQEGLELANQEIPLYRTDKRKEQIVKFQAITHNGREKTGVDQSAQFLVDETPNWSAYRFTFPKVKVGSIIEYKYTLQSPFYFNLDRWDFQGSIPKLYSRFHAEIPGNYVYNRVLKGDLPLSLNLNSERPNCFSIPRSSQSASCEVLDYAIENVPAFRETEPFMLSSENYISRLVFELSQFYPFSGGVEKYSKSWKDVDKEYRKDQDIGRQVGKQDFFTKALPNAAKSAQTSMEKARAVYKHIQDHFNWNEKYGIYRKVRVKKAYENRTGNIGEINISLINMLEAADIPAKIVLLSTRENGLPRRNQANITDFNYLVALATIDGKDYILDASDKFTPFGMLPYRALNYVGRVMDFKKDSYWIDLPVSNRNKSTSQVMLQFDLDNQVIKGRHREILLGYSASNRYRTLNKLGEEGYLEQIENNSFIEISEHNIAPGSTPKKLTQNYVFEMPGFSEDNRIRFNPFIVKFLSSSPFKNKKRQFPVEFGYPRSYGFNAIIPVPEGYEIEDLPAKKELSVLDGQASLKYECKGSPDGKNINLQFVFDVKNVFFLVENYPQLKELYDTFYYLQQNSLISLKKS